jgi:hypothetical protein
VSGHDGIFLIHPDGRLVELSERPYDSEDLLQQLLARYPDLLAGRQVDPEAPRRWLLVTREAGIPDDHERADRWSVDHLFLDQDGIPTLVEVKRSTDTRIRREVVGQMLDYAANCVVYWPVERIQELFREQCKRTERDPDVVLTAYLETEDAAAYWTKVKTNLHAGRIRMVFVSDQIPADLRRIVEFLNGQLNPAEMLAVEIRQYVSGDLRTLIPRVIGRTEQAQTAKSAGGSSTRQWDEQSFFDALTARSGTEAAGVARELLSWARSIGVDVWWGRGMRDGSFLLWREGSRQWFISCYTYGRIEVLFAYMKRSGPFQSRELREELRRRLNEIADVSIGSEALDRRPSIPLITLQSGEALQGFLAALTWMLEQYERA